MAANECSEPWSLRLRGRLAVLAVAASLIAWSSTAFAYRPFDGTDAAVADPGEMEIEFQPAGVVRSDMQKTLVAPAAVFSYGLADNWEAVLESQLQTPLSPSGPTSLSASGAFLKHVLRPGALQDQAGPSVATEFGVLLPDSIGDTGFGASIAGIISQRWQWGTVHWNIAGELTRDQKADFFSGVIIEGPSKWAVRPVAEIFYEEEFGQSRTLSGLLGAIWQARDNLAFDIGLRHALVNGSNVNEVRAGRTVGFPPRLLGSPDHK